jgi:glycosyltransferase involved in cell wall biosynthesis
VTRAGGELEPPSLPAISVALSAYNGERFLREQLESLARQSVLPAELVVCDDCSSDDTPGILEAFSRGAPFPVRIFRNEHNLGFNTSFLRVAERCAGPLIAFCDQDDVWAENKIGKCARFFASHPEVRLVIHAGQPVDEHLRPIGDVYPPVSVTRVAPPFEVNPWMATPGFAIVFDAALLRLADWKKRPPSRDLDGHEMDFDEWIYFLAWAVSEIGFIGDCLVQYRQHGSNLFGSPEPGWRARLRILLKEDFATHAGQAATAHAYADFLEQTDETRPQADADVRASLAAAARYWRAYEQLSRRRDALYEAETFTKRLRQLSKLVGSQAYRGRGRGGLGRSALIRDLRELMLPCRGVDAAPV